MTSGSIEKQGAQETEGDMNLKVMELKMEEIAIGECKTPTRSGNQIPAILKCPPAPRKVKRVSQVKGKSSAYEISFFEDINAEDIELFFQSIYEFTRANKKCKSI